MPRNPTLGHFGIRHPEQYHHFQVARFYRQSDRRQHTSILPLFLLAGIPQRLQNYDDPISQSMTRPSLPVNLDDLEETQKSWEELYRRRLVHYHYVKNTEEYNGLHCAALTDPMGVLRRRFFCHAIDPCEGETLALKVALIEATENWEALTGEAHRVQSCSTPQTHARRWSWMWTKRSGRNSRGIPEHDRLRVGRLGARRALRGGHDTQQAAEEESISEGHAGSGMDSDRSALVLGQHRRRRYMEWILKTLGQGISLIPRYCISSAMFMAGRSPARTPNLSLALPISFPVGVRRAKWGIAKASQARERKW